MMTRKLFLAALAALMILSLLGGCQLAVADGEITGGKDALCGVFVTLDYLDAGGAGFDLPQNWNGNPDEISFPETRVYATRREDENGGVDYTFDGVEGFRFFAVKIESPNGRYTSSISDGSIQDGNVKVSNEDIYLSGTIYFDVQYPCQIYTNPVYQTESGEVYATKGHGISFDSLQSEGECGSQKISATVTETTNGVKTSRTVEAEIKVQGYNTNREVVLKQMDSGDKVVAQQSITAGSIPKSIQVLPDCAYMILEEHRVDFEGKTVVKRTLMATDENYLTARFTGDRGIVQAYSVTLEKPGNGGKV